MFRLFAKKKNAVTESTTESKMNTLDVDICYSPFDLPRGYNQTLYDKVSNMITLSGKYVRDNQQRIGLSIVSRSNNNVNKMYRVMLNTVDKEINHIEKHLQRKK